MPSTRKTKTTASQGNGSGSEFDDVQCLRDLGTAVLTRLVVTHDDHLRSITAYYGDAGGVLRGGSTGSRAELVLAKGELITTVEGTFSDGAISKIQVETNKGTKWGPFGRVAHATTFVWSGFEPRMGLLYFGGKADSHIRILRATFASHYYPPERPVGIKYEKHVDSGADTTPTTPQSAFATNLMSPTVTLLIGPDGTVFNASQDLLCRLPFFRAALHGEFREATTRKITMPEDDPHTVAALIEFLYTGVYTYPYHTASEAVVADETGGPPPPAPDIDEGAYHVGVYATASKYGCTGLVDAAMKAFMFVLGQLKGVDVLRLWKIAYAKELVLGSVQRHEDVAEFRTGLPVLLKELYLAHPTEMERTSVDYPALLHDLLRLVVCDE